LQAAGLLPPEVYPRWKTRPELSGDLAPFSLHAPKSGDHRVDLVRNLYTVALVFYHRWAVLPIQKNQPDRANPILAAGSAVDQYSGT
jgi:hypothetical protein